MRKLLSFFIIVFSVFLISADFPSPSGMVNDYSGILSNSFKSKLEGDLRALKNKTGIEICVVITDSTNGNSIEDFATSLFEKWGIGSRDKNSGILLLIIPSQKKVRIEVGYGLEEYINDAKAGRIIRDSIAPYFKTNDYEAGIISGINELVKAIVSPDDYKTDLNNDNKGKSKVGGLIMVILFVFLFIKYPRLGMLLLIFGQGGRRGGFGGGGFGGGGGGFGGFGGGMSGGGGASGGW